MGVGRFGRFAAVALTACLVSLGTSSAASASTATTVNWSMNEPAGSTTMTDSGTAGVTGTIGPDVVTGAAIDGVTAYQWPFIPNINTAYRPERLVTVKDAAAIDPNGTSFRVEMRFRTKQSDKNIFNKGQSGNTGGYYKIETGGGFVKCLFRGPTSSLSIVSTTRVDDDRWHIVVCEHTPNGLTMTLDGTWTRTRLGTTGPINNSRPMSIGGKSKCDAVTAEGADCDYYSGWIDYITITKAT